MSAMPLMRRLGKAAVAPVPTVRTRVTPSLRTLAALWLVFLLATVAQVGVAQAADTPIRTSIALNFTWQATYAPLRYGEAKGFFKDAKVEAEIVPTQGGDQAMQLLAAGKADFAFTDADSFVTAAAKGKVDATAVYVWLDTSSLCLASLTPIESPKAMAGKSFATTAFSAARTVLPYILGQNGVDPKSVKVELVDFSVIYPMLFRGDVDTTQANDPGSWQNILAAAKKQGKTLHLTRLSDWGLVGYDKILLVRNEVLKGSPEKVKAVLAAIKRSRDEAHAKATDAEVVDLMKPVMPQVQDGPLVADWHDYKDAAKKTGPLDAKVLENVIERLKAVGQITEAPALDKLYDNTFL